MKLPLLALWLCAASVAAAAPAPAAAPAAAPDEPPAWSITCAEDAKKHCASAPNRFGCLAENRAKLTPRCATQIGRATALLARLRDARARWAAACGEEQKKLCAKGGLGRERMISCMKKNEAKLSDTCRKTINDTLTDFAALKRTLPNAEKALRACQSDSETYCAQSADGATLDSDCLRSVRAKLTPDCRRFVDGAAPKR